MVASELKKRARDGAWRRLLAVSMMVLPLGACDFIDGLLEVDAPSRVIGKTLEDPSNALLLVESSIADFECALAFYSLTTGLLSDELIDTQLAAATWDYDRRGGAFANAQGGYGTSNCNNTGNVAPGIYTPVSTARWSADNVLKNLETVWTDAQVPDRQKLIARAAAYAGYSYILLGEAFCSAAVDGGPELTPAMIFDLAEKRFTTAITAATASNLPDILGMARVGRARARINLGKKAEAAADAKLVAANFVKNAAYTTASARAGNQVFRWNNRFAWASVDPKFHNLTVGGVADPRVRVVNSGQTGADAFTRVFHQQKYPTESSPIAIASWVEAQLIIAEAEGGQSAVTIINQLHTRAGVPAFSSSDEAAIQNQVREERRRELFLDGHRFYDINRFKIPLDPAPGTQYPIKGGVYGSLVCLPLPEVERVNNPTLVKK